MIVFFIHLFLTQTDPGVPIVYAGFGALMLTTCISFFSHTQVNKYIGFLLLDWYVNPAAADAIYCH